MILKKYSRRLTLKIALFTGIALFQLATPLYAQQGAETMTTQIENDIKTLTELNQRYLISYRTGDADWFDNNLTDDFRETAPDGTILDKSEFLAKIRLRAGGNAQGVQAGELEIRLFGDLAIVHAIPTTPQPNGGVVKGGRYTDVYYKIAGKWLCVTAHLGGT